MKTDSPPAPLERCADLVRNLEGMLFSHGDQGTRMLELVRECGELAFSRAHYAPGHFTASAFILSPTQRDLLVVHHRKLGLWLQPGGHFEGGDACSLGAAEREAQEEVGVTGAEVIVPLFDLDIHAIPPFRTEPGHQHFDLRALLRAEQATFRQSEEVHAAAWIPIDELLDEHFSYLGVPTDESVRRSLRVVRERLRLV